MLSMSSSLHPTRPNIPTQMTCQFLTQLNPSNLSVPSRDHNNHPPTLLSHLCHNPQPKEINRITPIIMDKDKTKNHNPNSTIYIYIYITSPFSVKTKQVTNSEIMAMEKKRWVRGSCIGRGAFGTVNLGVNLSDGAVFAVKSVDLRSCLPSQLQALENEIRFLKTISSPFVVEYLGDDATTSFRNLHLEYLPRGTAVDLSIEESVRGYTWCLVSALSYLHARGITHCDVKGKNVLLGPSPGSAKLADFGSAVEKPIVGSPTRGSPLWMAPEVIRGEYQGPESDVWSLGCTVIEMLTGKPAWEADAEPFRRIGWSDELPLFPARLSSPGGDFLEKCFRRDYKMRWSCDQLLQHPFVSVCPRKDLIVYSSPRCVLARFDLNCDDGGSDVEELGANLNLGAEQRIRRLVSWAGANWELSDGWVVVRDGWVEGEVGARSEYFELEESPVMINVESSTCSSLSGEQNVMQSSEGQICLNISDFLFSTKLTNRHRIQSFREFCLRLE